MTAKEIRRAEEKKNRQKKHTKQIAIWVGRTLVLIAVIAACLLLPEYIASFIG